MAPEDKSHARITYVLFLQIKTEPKSSVAVFFMMGKALAGR
jgi:hypothetical protein